MKYLLLSLMSLALLTGGTFCLVRPYDIQRLAIRTMPARGCWPSREWAKTSQYILSVRICGVGALIMGLILLVLIILSCIPQAPPMK
jgi:hypothetical protein